MQWQEASYEIEGGALSIHSSLGTTKWTQPSSGKSESTTKRSSSSKRKAEKPNSVKSFFNKVFQRK
jgi:hypothetical protein